MSTLTDCQRFGSEGHDEPCYYCGEKCNSLAGNPSLWPVGLCHEDDPGRVKWHHTGCVSERLRIAPAPDQGSVRNATERERCAKEVDRLISQLVPDRDERSNGAWVAMTRAAAAIRALPDQKD